MIRRISLNYAPALGDVRAMSNGDTVALHSSATARRDWPRYAEALTIALTRGADIRQTGDDR